MRIERHVFGSFSGYTTLARSPGLTEADAHLLESGSYTFGQTEDAAFIDNLPKTYAYFTRALPNDRRAITRILPGTPDDGRRATLRLVTAVLSQHEWDTELHGDIRLLLADRRLWEWDPAAPALPSLDRKVASPHRDIEPASIPKLLPLLSQVERNFSTGQPLLLSPDEFDFHDLRALEMLLPPPARPYLTTAYLSLSPDLPATVNCLASATLAHRPLFHCPPNAAPLSTYAKHLQSLGLADGKIPLTEVAAYPSFGLQPDAPAPPAPTHAEPERSAAPASLHSSPPRRRNFAGLSAALLASAASFFAGRYVGQREDRAPDLPTPRTTPSPNQPIGATRPAPRTASLTDAQ